MVKSKHSILLVGNFLSTKGSRAPNEELAVRLDRLGWKIISTSSKNSRPLRLVDMVRTAWTRRHCYDVAQIDVFSGQAFLWTQVVCWTLRRAGKPYVLTLHGGKLPDFARRWPRSVRAILDSADAITAPSPYLTSLMEISKEKTHIIPNGLDLPKYRFRRRGEAMPKLIWLRAFHRLYNPTLGPKIVALLAADFPTITLTMIGPDKGDGSLEETGLVATRLNVDDRVRILGPIPKSEVPRHLNQGDIFINTTDADNTPVSVIEAMACGLCVVSTNVGGIPYLLDDKKNSLLVAADDAEGMADAVRKILTDPDLAARLSTNARKKVERFDWPNVVNQWERLFAALCARTSKGRRLLEQNTPQPR